MSVKRSGRHLQANAADNLLSEPGAIATGFFSGQSKARERQTLVRTGSDSDWVLVSINLFAVGDIAHFYFCCIDNILYDTQHL